MSIPDISVVMSVYNNEDTLVDALDSILSQERVDLEYIVIDDGSTDESGRLLDDVAQKDSRLQVIHKKNEGLTQALIEGCSRASAPWIARQDADDQSLPSRLRRQLDRALQRDEPLFVACGSVYRTSEGFDLFSSTPASNLNKKILEQGESPCAHGAAFFSRTAYDAVGGYRAEFHYAQDLDLFTRLAKFGPVVSVPDMLYAYTFSPNSISTHSAAIQKQFKGLIQRADEEALRAAADLSLKVREGSVRKANPFSGLYFIGSCLRKSNPAAAAEYFRKALALRPWSVCTAVRLIQCLGGSQ